MSGWKPTLERELNEIKKIKYSKINCVLQDIADKFQREGLSKLEVALINMAIVNKEMLNEKNAESFYRSRWSLLLKSEGMDEIAELKEQLKREQNCVDEGTYSVNNLLTSKHESWEVRTENWLKLARETQQQRK